MFLNKPDLIIADFMRQDTSNLSIWIVTCIVVLLIFFLRHHLAVSLRIMVLLNSRFITKSNVKKLTESPLIKNILQNYPLLADELQPLLYQSSEMVSTTNAKIIFKKLLIRSLTTI